MKTFWVKTQINMVGSYKKATIFLQILILKNKRNIFGFWLYCHKKIMLRQKKKTFLSSLLRQTFKPCGALVTHIIIKRQFSSNFIVI